MVTIVRAANWKIAVYGREHGVPHFHIEGPGFRASISIETNDLIIGSVPPSVLRDARSWAAGHRTELNNIWSKLNP